MVEKMSSCSLAINSGFARAVLRASANKSGDTHIQKRRILASGTFFAARPEPRLVDPILEPGVACFHGTLHWPALRGPLARPFWCEVPPKSLSDSRIGFEMTLMSHQDLLVAVVLDERGEAYWDCTATVNFELKK